MMLQHYKTISVRDLLFGMSRSARHSCMFLIGVYWGIVWTKSSPNLAGIEFRPKSMLQVWNDLLNALQKKPKTLTGLEVGMDRQIAAKEMEYDLVHCQTDSDPEI